MSKSLELMRRAEAHKTACAFRTPAGDHSYEELLQRSQRLAERLLGEQEDLNEARVAFRVPAGIDYAAVQWGIWQAGGIAVPLSLSATWPEIEYTLTDSETQIVVAPVDQREFFAGLALSREIQFVPLEQAFADSLPHRLPSIDSTRRAMILYTSGTTSKPKGVVTTHDNIQSQITALVQAWQWKADDCIPLFLPLHHIHGIINVLSCALWSGAAIEPFARFDVSTVLQRVAEGAYTVFMAVPTIYVKMIEELTQPGTPDGGGRDEILDGFRAMRLMISGSAALPATIHRKWSELTGQALLERYGMTEIGMALSNPLDGERRPGTVGQPLPGVELRLKTEAGEVVTSEGEPGEIQVRGPAVFKEYWKRDDVTASSFDGDWFRTGDMAVLEEGYYRIMGRLSVDIIKSGGYKISALEIEATLLQHDDLRECAVVGVPDDTWGEIVAAAVVLDEAATWNEDGIKSWAAERLSVYKVPKRWQVIDSLPRNAMGKVTKPEVGKLFSAPSE